MEQYKDYRQPSHIHCSCVHNALANDKEEVTPIFESGAIKSLVLAARTILEEIREVDMKLFLMGNGINGEFNPSQRYISLESALEPFKALK